MPISSPRYDYWFVGPSEGCTPAQVLVLYLWCVCACCESMSGQAAVQIKIANNKWEPIHEDSRVSNGGLMNWSMYVSKGWLSLQLCCNCRCNWRFLLDAIAPQAIIVDNYGRSHYSVHRSSIFPIPFQLRPSLHRCPIQRKASQANHNRTTTTARSLEFRCTRLEIKVWDIGRFGLRQRHRLAANEHGSPSIPHPKPWFVATRGWCQVMNRAGRRTTRLHF